MIIDHIKHLVQNDFDAVNNLLIEKIQSQVGLIENLSQHIIQSGGKRLRPLLVLLSSKACGYNGTDHITMAAMIECFHTATLLHDDVVDESTLRRGRETANSIWGSKASILVGDYLLTQSVQLLTSVGNMEILRLITDTAHQISCGEIKQLTNRRNHTLGYEQYFEIIRAKTALLFAAGARIGGHLVKADISIQENLYEYGLRLGNAFQLIDDMLDYCSDSQTLGKNPGDDLADCKATLPLLYALEQGSEVQKQYIRDSLKTGSLEYLPEILKALEETKALEYTRQVAAEEVDKAISALTVLHDSPEKKAMEDLARFALERIY